MTSREPSTDVLLTRAADVDESAIHTLLQRHRNRLRTMVSLLMDRRLVARFDPSDVAQDALAEAYRKLPKYAKSRLAPFG